MRLGCPLLLLRLLQRQLQLGDGVGSLAEDTLLPLAPPHLRRTVLRRLDLQPVPLHPHLDEGRALHPPRLGLPLVLGGLLPQRVQRLPLLRDLRLGMGEVANVLILRLHPLPPLLPMLLLGGAADRELLVRRAQPVLELLDVACQADLRLLERLLILAEFFPVLAQRIHLGVEVLEKRVGLLLVLLEALLLREPRLHLPDMLLLAVEEPPDLVRGRGQDRLQRRLLAHEEVALVDHERHLLEERLL
mmetsp:Transcript_36370/g.86080  ORF Transcript_36370/g.86080 Transcript_36370/m.86080 type:complete len:246 (-) Transcript_36370:371-1108(-)